MFAGQRWCGKSHHVLPDDTVTKLLNDVRTTGKQKSLSMTQRSERLHTVERSLLVVVDVQEKLLPVIPDRHSIVDNTRFLLDVAQTLGVNAIATEQYPKGLGQTIPELRTHSAVRACYEKLRFSAAEVVHSADFAASTSSGQARQIVLAGIETHICILQTALDLLSLGHEVTLIVDATGSRFRADQEVAFRRLEAEGMTLATAETIAFEWCEAAGTDAFKTISRLVRDRAGSTS